MSLSGNDNIAPVTFDKFCSVVRERADLTPEYAVSQIATILNVSAGSSAMYALRGLLQSDSWLSDENLRPIYSKLCGGSSQTAAPGGYVNNQSRASHSFSNAPVDDFKNSIDLKSIDFDSFAKAVRKFMAVDMHYAVKLATIVNLGLSSKSPLYGALASKLSSGESVDTPFLQSLFREMTGRQASPVQQPQTSHPYQSLTQSSVSGVVGVGNSGFEQFCQVVRQYAYKKPDDSVRLIANALNVTQDNSAINKLRKILSATRDPSDDELRKAYKLFATSSGKAAQTRLAGKAGAQCVPNKKMNDSDAANFLGMTEVEF